MSQIIFVIFIAIGWLYFFTLDPSEIAEKSTTSTIDSNVPPQHDYIFKTPQSVQSSSEPITVKSREEILTQCKIEYKLAKMIMDHRQMNYSMVRSLDLIYKDSTIPDNLKDLAKNGVILVQNTPVFAIRSNKYKAISEFANKTQQQCFQAN